MDMEHGEMSDQKRMWKMKWREQMAIRVLTGVIVVIFVFWCGFEFGEIRASVGLMHGGYEMMRGGGMTYTEVTGGPLRPVSPAVPITPTGGTASGGNITQ